MKCLADHELACLLAEDAPAGDLTTDSLGIGRRSGRVTLRACQAMTVCAVEEAARLYELCGAQARILQTTGSVVGFGADLLQVSGAAAALHRASKTAQVLMEWSSGIASEAAAIVTAANGVPVACTRKNVPGTKAMSVKAVKAGGATIHRLGLSETLLVFAEHRLFLDRAPEETVARLKRREPEKKIVVEVASVDEALVWAHAGVDVLQLEKFLVGQVAEVRRRIDAERPGVKLAATGGVHAGNASEYVAAGADLLVTTAPYLAARRDVKVIFQTA